MTIAQATEVPGQVRALAEQAPSRIYPLAIRERITDLYTGAGGITLTVMRAAQDAEAFASVQARTSMLTHRVGAVTDAVSRTSRILPDPHDTELHGRSGTRLVFHALQSRAVPVSGADGVLGTTWVE